MSDWEEESVYNFLASPAKVKVPPKGIDEILWSYDSNNSFTIKRFYPRLYDSGNYPNFQT